MCAAYSRHDRLERVLRDAQIPQRVLSVRILLGIDAKAVAPPAHLCPGHRYLRPAASSAPMQHVEEERLLAEVEVGDID